MKKLENLLNFENLLKLTFIVFIGILSLTTLNDPDIFFHVKNGEYIFYHWIPQIDPYSMHGGLTYIQHEWLSDIIFYLIYSINGFAALWAFKAVFTFVIFLTIYYAMKGITDKNSTISFFTAGLITILNYEFIVIRPQIFSYVILILEIFLLEQYEKTKRVRYLCLLPVLSILLINLHGAVAPFFFAVIIVYIADNYLNIKNIDKIRKTDLKESENGKMILAAIISFLVMAINPNGGNTFFYLYHVVGQSSMINNISELQTLDIISDRGLTTFVIFAGIILTMIFAKNKIYFRQIFFIFGTLFMAFSAIRLTTYFYVFSLMMFGQYLSAVLTTKVLETNDTCTKILKKRNVVGNLICAVPFAMALYFTNPQMTTRFIDTSSYPNAAVSYLKSQNDVTLFNDFKFGHFLIYNGIKVFIDGRAEIYTKEVNNTTVFDDFLDTIYLKKNPEEIFKKYNFNYYLIEKDRPLNWYLQSSSKYIKVMEDNNFVLYKNK